MVVAPSAPQASCPANFSIGTDSATGWIMIVGAEPTVPPLPELPEPQPTSDKTADTKIPAKHADLPHFAKTRPLHSVEKT